MPPLSVEVYKLMENSANGLRLLLTDDLERFEGLRSLTCAPLTSLVAAAGVNKQVLRKSSLRSEMAFIVLEKKVLRNCCVFEGFGEFWKRKGP